MRKLFLSLVLLALGTLTFAGCDSGASKPITPKPDTTKPADVTAPAEEAEKPADKPAEKPADPATPAAPAADPTGE